MPPPAKIAPPSFHSASVPSRPEPPVYNVAEPPTGADPSTVQILTHFPNLAPPKRGIVPKCFTIGTPPDSPTSPVLEDEFETPIRPQEDLTISRPLEDKFETPIRPQEETPIRPQECSFYTPNTDSSPQMSRTELTEYSTPEYLPSNVI